MGRLYLHVNLEEKEKEKRKRTAPAIFQQQRQAFDRATRYTATDVGVSTLNQKESTIGVLTQRSDVNHGFLIGKDQRN